MDLVDNPEQYTGYSRAAGASRIWDELHRYNSFHSPGCCGEEAAEDLLAMPVDHFPSTPRDESALEGRRNLCTAP